MSILEVDHAQMPFSLLLEADPSEKQVLSYLPHCRCYVAEVEGRVVGVCAIKPLADGATYELMNIAVGPKQQGVGSRLLNGVIAIVKAMGANKLLVGTGTFGYQLTFYQRAGFRVVAVDRDFFLHHYDEPIVESGIQHKNMLRLELDFVS
ncbi:GNAT family N-acetyltransferase [Endozoicomonas ascidiicola]|uniref:GNAT family N-acetyltransferase n=1 Tax=Endozoicomonas ascidiicola TaxID=1698521 RepID=UPI00082A21C3|nr:GNAT family N-acetyltransferase [Endozoicomonas ascidiicola]